MSLNTANFYAAMLALFRAEPDGGFRSSCSGGLHYRRARRGARLPYAVFGPVGATEASTYGEEITSILVQVSVYAADSDACALLTSQAQALFCGACLAVAGARDTILEMERPPAGPMPDGDTNDHTWQDSFDLSALIQTDQ